MDSVLSCLKDRVKIHHPELHSDAVTILATQGWERSGDNGFADIALGNLSE